MDPAAPTPTLPEIDKARSAFIDAVRRHEPAAIAELYGDGARLVAPNAGVMRGREAAAAFWGAGMETGMTAVELVPDDLQLLLPHALEVGRYALRVEPEPGLELIDRGRYLLLYRLDDGRWVRVAEMFAPDEATPTPGTNPKPEAASTRGGPMR